MYSFIVLPALALYLYLAWKAMGAAYRSTTHPVLKFAYPSLALAVLAVLPFADIIYPRWKLAQLCATEVKTEILATTTLPAEFFNIDGTLVTRSKNPFDLNWERLGVVLKLEGDERKIGAGGIVKISRRVVDKRNGKVLVSQEYLRYRGGWIRTSSSGFGATACLPDASIESQLVRAVSRAL
jgi:hypothetical protein